jgi:hypothetical protein
MLGITTETRRHRDEWQERIRDFISLQKCVLASSPKKSLLLLLRASVSLW